MKINIEVCIARIKLRAKHNRNGFRTDQRTRSTQNGMRSERIRERDQNKRMRSERIEHVPSYSFAMRSHCMWRTRFFAVLLDVGIYVQNLDDTDR